MPGFIEVLPITDIPRLGSRVVKRGDIQIALFRTEDDRVFALEDKCPHKGGPLSQGIVHGCRVTCPLHNMVIELASGTAVAPDQGHVRSIVADVRDGAIWLDFNDLVASQPLI